MSHRWEDSACVLGMRPLNEKHAIVELLTAQHGRMFSVARFGMTSKQRGIYHAGNKIMVAWEARVATQMGHITAEVEQSNLPYVVNNPLKLLIMQCAHAVCHQFLYEHTPEPQLYEALCDLYTAFAQKESMLSLYSYAQFEFNLLSSCGYGLDLERCAVTGSTQNLTYISPKSGRAVSRDAGLPYHEKLFILPSCYVDENTIMTLLEIQNALKISLHFMAQRLCMDGINTIPEVRYRLDSHVSKLS